MVFKATMNSDELALELVRTMDDFRPAVAQLGRDALRWRHCLEFGFPMRAVEQHTGHTEWWTLLKLSTGVKILIATTPDEVIDQAMEAVKQSMEDNEDGEDVRV